MKPKLLVISVLPALIALVLLYSTTSPALAARIGGTAENSRVADTPDACTPHVNIEPGGDIDIVPEGGSPENVNGALFWDGSKWDVSGTWGHMYYTCLETGERIKNYTLLATLDGSGSPGVVFAQKGFTVTQSIYTYTVSAADNSQYYRYQAVEYSVDTALPAEKLILRSRGTGNGTSRGYLDIYIQENYTCTVAFRGDPVWYSYDNTTARQAAQITGDTQGLVGYMPTYTPSTRAQYWLDLNGGSDMVGVSYYFRTGQIAPVGTKNLGSSFPTEFRIKFMHADELFEFIVLPRITSETVIPAQKVYLPLIVK